MPFYWTNNRHKNNWKRMEFPDIEPKKNFFWQWQRGNLIEKGKSSINDDETLGHSYAKTKINMDHIYPKLSNIDHIT